MPSTDCARPTTRSSERRRRESTERRGGPNLHDLSERLQRGAYRAKPVRRAYIAKADGRQLPLGVPALEDKIVQRAVVEVLNAIYEQDFIGFSYGFRPKRSPHDALNALAVAVQTRGVNWVLDADIRSFFDTLEQGWLVKFVEHRVADRRVIRLIQKWLSAGVLEEGRRTRSEVGTVQGGSVTPRTQKVTSAAAGTSRAPRGQRATSFRRWRRGHGDAMPEDDLVVTDEYVFDDKPCDTLAFADVQCVGGHSQSSEKRRERLGKTQVRGSIASLLNDRP